MRRTIPVAVAVMVAGLMASTGAGQTSPLTMTSSFVAGGLSQPVFVTYAPGDRSRLFVVEKAGRIKIIRNGQVVATPFLDIATQVNSGSESGMLGLAFAPDYATSGVFYVFFTRRGMGGTNPVVEGSAIARFHVSADADVADPTSLQLVNFAQRPAAIHNGGWIGFGPDGMLYATLGERGTSQNLTSAHGKVLRIEVTSGVDDFPEDPNRNFHIPAGNPFVGVVDALPEIYAFGLRNPWRASIDQWTGDMWIGDVGQSTPGEIDVIPAASHGGQNFGWPCFDSATVLSSIGGCGGDVSAITQGIWTYPRGSLGASTTGGYVYRGCAIDSAKGLYFFADYTSGRVWTLHYTPGVAVTASDVVERTTELLPAQSPSSFRSFSAFGEDADGELYLVSVGGTVFKIIPRTGTFTDINANGVPDGCEPPFCGPADLAGLGGTLGPDNQLTADDLIAFLDAFFRAAASADLAGMGGIPGADGQLTVDDLIYYLDQFFNGCP